MISRVSMTKRESTNQDKEGERGRGDRDGGQIGKGINQKATKGGGRGRVAGEGVDGKDQGRIFFSPMKAW